MAGERGRETLCLPRFKRHISETCHPLLPDVRKSIVLFEGSLSSPACPSGKSRIEMQMSMEHWWNDTDRGRLKYWERNII